MIFKIFLVGIFVLFCAIIINLIAGYFNIDTWYDFLNNIKDFGIKESFQKLGFASIIFLFLVYPFSLGFFSYLGFLLLKIFS